MTDRAQSEAISFVMVFVLITLTVGVVSTVGISSLQDSRHAEQVNNVERAFEILADNVRDVSRFGAPSRATEMKLAGGSVGFGDPVTIEVTDGADTTTVKTKPVVFDDGQGTQIRYVAGAIVRVEDGNAVALSDPGWLLGPQSTDDSPSAVLHVPAVRGRGALAGQTNMLVVVHGKKTTFERTFLSDATNDNGNDVTVSVTSPYERVWARYFDERGLESKNGADGDGVVTFEFPPAASGTYGVHVTATELQTEFVR